VSGNHFVWIGGTQQQVSRVAAQFSPEDWQRLSAGAGSKGPRWYEWAAVETNSLHEGWTRWLLVRRRVDNCRSRKCNWRVSTRERNIGTTRSSPAFRIEDQST
jgi:hypothetical protein